MNLQSGSRATDAAIAHKSKILSSVLSEKNVHLKPKNHLSG